MKIDYTTVLIAIAFSTGFGLGVLPPATPRWVGLAVIGVSFVAFIVATWAQVRSLRAQPPSPTPKDKTPEEVGAEIFASVNEPIAFTVTLDPDRRRAMAKIAACKGLQFDEMYKAAMVEYVRRHSRTTDP